ncbi:hypothetical protein PGT21_032526 [Puccinia graminis f. sp. tritici]|uniref:Uncharacterized protein n=1 Tax=Puccinia graminis f. sp. tritici TaxID=56615 RepID=A0A5B0MGN2_PUCGR|nr:hypothetical protein PGT21_032526 [Puccinia graminis f. sp. tritici]
MHASERRVENRDRLSYLMTVSVFLLDSNPPCRLKSIDLFLMPPRGGYCDFPSLAFHDQRIASGSSAGM